MLRIALIANPKSGGGEADRVADALRAAGADVVTIPIERTDDAASAGADRIAVAGGDGSIGVAAAAAADAGVPLVVVPCGTANDFAGQAGLPTSIEEATALATEGSELRRLELARVGGRPFVNVVSAGLAPAAAEEAGGLKEKLGALAYPVGAVGAGLSTEPIPCVVVGDGEQLFEGEAWQVSIASSGAFGGGSTLIADSSDGLLDAVVVERSSRARLVKVAYGLTIGALEDQAGVVSARAREIALRIDPDELLNVDGELIAAGTVAGDGIIRLTAERPGFELVVG